MAKTPEQKLANRAKRTAQRLRGIYEKFGIEPREPKPLEKPEGRCLQCNKVFDPTPRGRRGGPKLQLCSPECRLRRKLYTNKVNYTPPLMRRVDKETKINNRANRTAARLESLRQKFDLK